MLVELDFRAQQPGTTASAAARLPMLPEISDHFLGPGGTPPAAHPGADRADGGAGRCAPWRRSNASPIISMARSGRSPPALARRSTAPGNTLEIAGATVQHLERDAAQAPRRGGAGWRTTGRLQLAARGDELSRTLADADKALQAINGLALTANGLVAPALPGSHGPGSDAGATLAASGRRAAGFLADHRARSERRAAREGFPVRRACRTGLWLLAAAAVSACGTGGPMPDLYVLGDARAPGCRRRVPTQRPGRRDQARPACRTISTRPTS